MMWWWSRHTVYDERWQDFQAADEFGVVNQGASVLGFAGLSCSTKEFHATALIKNGWLCLLRHAFISLFFFPSLSLSLPRFSERTQHKDVGGGKMGQGAGGVGEQKIWKRRNWNDGVMSDRRHGGTNNWIKGGTGPFLAYINVWILKVLLLMCGCGCAALHPPPLLFLLANHHTTLLYLGHSNVLLLSPLADVLCSNLRKKKKKNRLGGGEDWGKWEKRKSSDSSEFLFQKLNLLFCNSLPIQYLSLLPLSLLVTSPSTLSSL